MDRNKPARRSGVISVWKWAAVTAIGVGGLVVCSTESLFVSHRWLYWSVGISAVGVTIAGGVAIAYLERRWPEAERSSPATSHSAQPPSESSGNL